MGEAGEGERAVGSHIETRTIERLDDTTAKRPASVWSQQKSMAEDMTEFTDEEIHLGFEILTSIYQLNVTLSFTIPPNNNLEKQDQLSLLYREICD